MFVEKLLPLRWLNKGTRIHLQSHERQLTWLGRPTELVFREIGPASHRNATEVRKIITVDSLTEQSIFFLVNPKLAHIMGPECSFLPPHHAAIAPVPI